MGHYKLPRRQRHYPADHRLVDRSSWSPQLLPPVDWVFTVSSGLCGLATSLNQLILFRVVQGLAGGGLQPCSQGVLLDAFPREKQGAAMTLFGLAALLAPVVGPT